MKFEDFDEKLRVNKSGGKFSNVSQLKLSPNLEAVYLWNNKLSSLEGIEILKWIKYLNLMDNKLEETSLEPLRYCIELQYLVLSRNQIASLDTLPVLPNLKYLELANNQLNETSFEPLGYCLELQNLGLWSNQISSLATMPVLPNLMKLSLWGNQITSLAGLPVLPNLKYLLVGGNNISTLSDFPFLPSLEELFIDGPILQIPRVETALILLVGPSLKTFNFRYVLASEVEVAKQYPAHTSFCIRNGWLICEPHVANESTFSFLTKLWKERIPPGYKLREAFTDQPSEDDVCACHFSFDHLHGLNYGLDLKYQWFVGDTIPADFSPIEGATDRLYWPKKEDVGKYLKVECISLLGGTEFSPIFALCKPVLPGTGIPKVIDINVLGEFIEGKILKGSVKVAWCGGKPCKGASSWLRRRLVNSETITEAKEEEYKLTLHDVDAYIVYVYTPITQAGLKGESTNFTTGFIKAGPPLCNSLNLVGSFIEGACLGFTASYTGGVKGNCIQEWYRIKTDGNRQKLTDADTLDLTLDVVGMQIELVFTPVRDDGEKGSSKSVVSDVIISAEPKGLELNIPECFENCEIMPTKSYFGGKEGYGKYTWYRTKKKLNRQDLICLTSSSEALIIARTLNYEPSLEDVGSYLALHWIPTRYDGRIGDALLATSNNSVIAAEPRGVELIIPNCCEDCEILPIKSYFGGHEGSGKYTWYRTKDKLGQQDLILLTSSPEALIVARTLNYTPLLEDVDSYLALRWIPTRSDGTVGDELLAISNNSVLPGIPRLVLLEIMGDAVEGAMLVAFKRYMGGIEGDSIFCWYSVNSYRVQTEIEGAACASYTLKCGDIGCHIYVSCKPVRNDGAHGPVCFSRFIGPIIPGKKEEEQGAIPASAQNALAQSSADYKKKSKSALQEKVQKGQKIQKERAEVKRESIECCTRFTYEELQKATDNFNESHKLGQGGFGTVYKGFLRHTPVAIKMLKDNLLQDTRGFNEEIKTLTQVRHPNIVTLIGSSEEDAEKLALVYEFVPGGSLQDYLVKPKNNNSPLTWKTRIRIASDICSALIFLHSTPRVHGDLKPDNILLDLNYVSKICDFGTCRVLRMTDTTMTPHYAANSSLGFTPGYVDPSFLQSGELNAKSDVYSFGIVLLQLVTGREVLNNWLSVHNAIRDGKFGDVVDPSATWPKNNKGEYVEAMKLADLGLECSHILKEKRPDLVNNAWSVIESLMKAAASSS